MEAKLQSQIIKWLKSKGCYVLKTRPQPGIPVGCPDVIFFYEGAWGAIEVKASLMAKFRPGQYSTLKLLKEWSPFVYVASPETWAEIKEQLITQFF